MIPLSLLIGVNPSEIIKIKPHLDKFQPGDGHFVSFFPHDGLEDFPVSVQDAVYLAGLQAGFPAPGSVEIVFAFYAAKAFIASAGQWSATMFALPVHFWKRWMIC